MHKTDSQLVSEYIVGDDAALEVLVARHLTLTYRFVYKMTGNAQDAEDITQETFIKAWRALKTFDQHKNFTTWLLTIAKRTAIDMLRKKRGLSFADFQDDDGANRLIDMLAADSRSPLAEAEGIEVRAAAENLSDPYREIISLHYDDGLSLEEISMRLEKPANTIKSQHRRALIALRKLLHI
ncbi:MAG: RNA polymerase sigma factor [Patescibacteria group bacterium]